jgi:hypothetical protein
LVILLIGLRRGSRAALWWGLPIGMMLINSRLDLRLPGGLLLSNHTITTYSIFMAVLLGGSLGPLSRLRWCWADLVAILIPVCQLVSNWFNGQIATFSVLTVTCLTLGPYILGRLYLRSPEDVGGALRPLMLCLMALSICIIFETVTGRNIAIMSLGKGRAQHMRVGLTRAVATLGGAIALGMAMLTLLPWSLEAGRRAKFRLGPSWWRLMPWMNMAAIWGSISRGPMFASGLLLSVYAFFRRPGWRGPILASWCLGALLAWLGANQLKQMLYFISGETELVAEEKRTVVINDQEYTYSGSDHRWLLFKAYERQIQEAGLFGYGYNREEAVEQATEHHRIFYSIDCNPLAYLLAYGWLGVVLFHGLAFLSLWGLVKVALDREHALGPLAAGLFAAIVTFQLGLVTVALLRSLQMYWYFLAGAGVTVAQLGRTGQGAARSVYGAQGASWGAAVSGGGSARGW